MARFSSMLKHAWNAFSVPEQRREIRPNTGYYGASYGRRPDRPFLSIPNEKSIITSIYTRLGIDAASINIKHVRTDEEGRYTDDMLTGLNYCLTQEANVDQAATQFRQDAVMSLLEYGTIAIVPVDTTVDPNAGGGWDVKTMRIGRIVTWYPQYVQVDVYNEITGLREQITLPKSAVAIIENPLYSIMNETNSTLQRLIRKLNLLDSVDEQSASGKLDLIIQLPYVIKSEARRQQAEQRRTDIEFQLKGSQYGIAYTDGTEKITQLNRPAENNLLAQVQYLTDMLYSQLGLTPEVMNGTAAEPIMRAYYVRTVDPILVAITEAMSRTFLTKTARSQNQAILFFRDPFKLIPIGGDGGIADIADKFSRNEILTSNELRQVVGFKPSKDPGANKLQNSNMPQPSTDPKPPTDPNPPAPTEEDDNG